MKQLKAAAAKHLMHVGITVFAFLSLNWINEILFSRLDQTNGITWIFMPAGVRLLSTIFFGLAGLEGMLLVGIYLNFHHFMFHSDYRSWSGAVAGSLGPYLASLFAIHWFNLRSRFERLTAQRLLFAGVLCGLMSPIFHHVFLWVLTGTVDWTALTAMITGDTTGILIVLYLAKCMIAINDRYGLYRHLLQRFPFAHKFGNRAVLINQRRW